MDHSEDYNTFRNRTKPDPDVYADEYDPDADTVIEAEAYEPPPAEKLNCVDHFVMRCHRIERWLAENFRDLIAILLFVVVTLGIYCINAAFYILGKVHPEDWTFIDTGVAEGFYTTWMVLVALGIGITYVLPIFEVFPSYHQHRWFAWVLMALSISLFVGLPFGLVTHYKHVEYNKLCRDNIYEIEIKDRAVYYEGAHLYDIKSSIGSGGKTLTVHTGPIFDDHRELEVTFCCGNNIVPYNGKLDLFNSAVKSRSDKWYNDRADFGDGIKFMNHPSEDETLKICMNKFGNETLQITTVIPVLQKRMKVCRSCMEDCMSECKRWDTRLVPYTYQTCSGSGKYRSCTTHTGIRTETYCAEYRSYGECKGRCDAPACAGITL